MNKKSKKSKSDDAKKYNKGKKVVQDATLPRFQPASVLVLPVSLIKPPVLAMRRNMIMEDTAELEESMTRYGLINPITVIKSGENFEVVAGHRRYLAAKRLGWKTLEARVEYSDSLKSEMIKIHENIQRQNVNVVEESEYLAALLKRLNITQSKLAEMIGKSSGYVSERLKISEWSPDLREAVANDELSFSAARELATIKDDAIRQNMTAHAIKNGVTPATAKDWAHDANQYTPPAESEAGESGFAGPSPTPTMPAFPCGVCGQVHEVPKLRTVRVCGDCAAALTDAKSNMTATARQD